MLAEAVERLDCQLLRAGRVAVSHLFRDASWHLRIWGDVPRSLDMPSVTGEIDNFICREMFPGAAVVSIFDFDREVRSI